MQKDNIENIPFNYFYWGPLLMKFKVSDKLVDDMLKKAEKLTIEKDDARPELVATIKKELNFRTEDIDFFANQTSNLFNTYLKFNYQSWLRHNEGSNLGKPKVKKLTTRGLWINYMKKHDFNPIHEHFGDLSFILFCDIPEKLKIENENNITKSAGPGSISFLYGDGMAGYICNQSFLPEKGDFFIFPAKLQHYVHPFESDVTRISIAGNMDYHY
jgi:hypothetical protein